MSNYCCGLPSNTSHLTYGMGQEEDGMSMCMNACQARQGMTADMCKRECMAMKKMMMDDAGKMMMKK